jgi:UDP-glucose 4-epimerase
MLYDSQTVLITGGAGRLGTIVGQKIIDQGFKLRIFDLDSKRNRGNVKELAKNPNVKICWGDVTRPDQVNEVVKDADFVLHMAAILPPWAYAHPDLTYKVNVGGTENVVNAIKASGRQIPLMFTSSAAAFGPTPNATEPLSTDTTICKPEGAYGETKLKAENVIRESGIDYVILRLTATMYLSFEFSDFKRMFSVPLATRVEYCHPYDTSEAIVTGIQKFDDIKGETLMIAGGPGQRMTYGDMIARMLRVYGLPLPPASKFTADPYYLDWYDTSKAQKLLGFQKRDFKDFLRDLENQVKKAYTPLFLYLMRHFIGPLFGKMIVRMMRE